MTDTSDLILPILQRLQAQGNAVDRKLDILIDDTSLLKVRMTSLEEAMAGFNRRMDNLEIRISRIERRIDLTDA